MVDIPAGLEGVFGGGSKKIEFTTLTVNGKDIIVHVRGGEVCVSVDGGEEEHIGYVERTTGTVYKLGEGPRGSIGHIDLDTDEFYPNTRFCEFIDSSQ